MEKIKNLLFTLELEGKGVVNMDSNDQKYVLGKTHLRARNENVSFAKKSFTVNDNSDDKNDIDYKLKISHDCIGHDMFKRDMVSNVPNVVHHDLLLYTFLASPVSIIRGYMLANKKETLKRTGGFHLCDAIQTCNAKSILEVGARAGEKMSKDGTDDKSDNTFFYRETVGDIEYSAKGDIDLMAYQFISCDNIFDRYSFNPDMYKYYKEFLKKKMPDFNSELGYYQLRDSIIQIPEYGVLLSNENVVFLVKETLKRLLGIDIKRKGAYAKVNSLKIKLVKDPTVDTYNNPDNWIVIKNNADIDALNFDVEFFYDSNDFDEAKALRKDFDERIAEDKRLEKEAEKEKKAAQKEKKDKKSEE
jgi:hypothetical protein